MRLKSLLRKLKPVMVDSLLYGFAKGSAMPEPLQGEFPFRISFSSDEPMFYIEEEGKIIHKSKIFKTSFLLRNFGYRQPYIAIGDCFTHSDFRGRGIYPKVIREAISYYKSTHSIYMLVGKDNIASIKGIEKAGLTKLGNIKCLKIGPLYLNKSFS